MWPTVTRSASPWGLHRAAVTTSSVSKKTPNVHRSDRTDLFGVVLHFDSISSVKDLPEAVSNHAGFTKAQVIVSAGAFDEGLQRSKVGIVRGSVRFQFDHDDDYKTASTISGALQVFADRKTLFFYIRGGSRDGANSVLWARCSPSLREVSAGFYIREFTALPAFGSEPDTIIVTRAELFEISLVQSGSFPRTSVQFM